MRMVDLIEAKRAGMNHTPEEIRFIVEGYTRGQIPDYQMSAWMMAVCFQGMGQEETAALTLCMRDSGDVLDLSDLAGIKVDKHSTGGVGDTTSLVIGPVVAACGGTVAKLSGRGLGHTGGTLDKMESVIGIDVGLSLNRFKQVVRACGVCISGQTGNLVPADRMMYALRDVTATVRSIPLVAASVMSKKLAAGADAVLLDVKYGNGAFMQSLEEARALAQCMVDIGARVGKNIRAVITDMNQPLGMNVGNGLELKEAAELLMGKIAPDAPLYRLCVMLAGGMLNLAGLAADLKEGEEMAKNAILDGSAYERFITMFRLMGGDVSLIQNPERLCRTVYVRELSFETAGYYDFPDTVGIGTAARKLGAGREVKTDEIDPAVGIVLHKRVGDRVEAGESVATLYANDERKLTEGCKALEDALRLNPDPVSPPPLVYEWIDTPSS